MSKMAVNHTITLTFNLSDGKESVILLPMGCNDINKILNLLREMQELVIVEKINIQQIEAIKKAEANEIAKKVKSEEEAQKSSENVEKEITPPVV